MWRDVLKLSLGDSRKFVVSSSTSSKDRETQWNSLWLKPALSTFYSKNEVKKLLEQKDFENAWKLGNAGKLVSFVFPRFSMFSLDFVSGNIETLAKTKLFPSGPDIKCIMFARILYSIEYSSQRRESILLGSTNMVAVK